MSGDSGGTSSVGTAIAVDPVVSRAVVSSASTLPAVDVAGIELAQQLSAVDPSSLNDYDLVEYVAACERVESWAASLRLAGSAEFARRPARVEVADEDPAAVRARYAPVGEWAREFADDELAARLRTSGQTAGREIELGCRLARLPRTAAALAGGRIDVRRARVVAEATKDLDAATARGLEAELVRLAEEAPPARLRQRVRTLVVAADPAAAEQRRVRAVADRRVVITPGEDGTAELWAQLPAGQAMAIRAALRAAARASKADAGPEDTRTTDQRMADALAAPFIEALATGELRPIVATGTGNGSDIGPRGGLRLAGQRGCGVELQVTVAASTLLGHDDAPAQLDGYGPITAEAARELAGEARMRRILTDPRSGAVLDVGRTTYTPPAPMARHVVARSVRCTYPGCGWPAAACDLDHTVPFPEGPTSAANLGPRCRRHHRLKHSRGVRVEQDPDGSTTWRLPTGHTYRVDPPAIGPPTRPDPPSDRTREPGPEPPG